MRWKKTCWCAWPAPQGLDKAVRRAWHCPICGSARLSAQGQRSPPAHVGGASHTRYAGLAGA